MSCFYDIADSTTGCKAEGRLFAVTTKSGKFYHEFRSRVFARDGSLLSEMIMPAEWVDSVTEADYNRAIPRKSKA